MPIVGIVTVLGVSCSSTDEGADGAAASTVSTPASTTTTAPLDYRSAMVSRLSDEWGDAMLAEAVVEAVGPDGLTAWEAKVPVGEVATSPLLTYLPPTTPASDVDSVVVFAFGNRLGPDGSPEPGPTNEALADLTAAFVAEHPVPVYAQWEVARFLQADGVPGVTSIEPVADAEGNVVYLSTRGVADAAVSEAAATATTLGRVGVVCFADHQGRCLLTAQAAGMDATTIDGLELPSAYDPESGQPWTRERVAYLTTDLSGRLLA